MTQLDIELVTPEKVFCKEQADMVTIPGSEGDFGVLPGHAPLISHLRPGVIAVDTKDGQKRYFVAEGFAEVTEERCIILAKRSLDITDLSAADVQAMYQEKSEVLEKAYKKDDIASAEQDVAFLDQVKQSYA